MNGKKWTAAVLAAGMFFTTNFMTMGVAEMTEQREAVKVVQTAGRDRLGDFAPDFAANEFVQASATAKHITIKRSIVILRTRLTFKIQTDALVT